MSNHLEADQDLKNLVKKAAAKERRILRFSLIFTIASVTLGFAWIAYSVNKVIKLEQRKTNLEVFNNDLETRIKERTELLNKLEATLTELRDPLTQIAQEKSIDEAKKQAVVALASLSNAQVNVEIANNQPPVSQNQERPPSSPTPTPLTTVPEVTGLTLSSAGQKLRQSRLTATQKVHEGKGPGGTILNQDPVPGTRVPIGTSVIVYIIPLTVPTLTGLVAADASQRVRSLGLKVIEEAQLGKGILGTVLYQDPIPGTRLPAGASVKLYVVSGPPVVAPAPRKQ
ncbi:MAG: PASTA domain-containing protein [Pyrinomonadaceae bacterium]